MRRGDEGAGLREVMQAVHRDAMWGFTRTCMWLVCLSFTALKRCSAGNVGMGMPER